MRVLSEHINMLRAIGGQEHQALGKSCGRFSSKIHAKVDGLGLPVTPGKKNRTVEVEYDRHLYKKRNAVERFFNRIKHFRRIATRYDKTASMFLGALTIVSILLWIKS